ncbi:MAG TPA: hypothetical protein DCZ94_19435 [Lentisphaeria bacterium]|nr:MAG: hypothetical protein A2X48_07580 [Lentisphaerae bacterium GWF2_49_21]HBC89117.1 hypothetical protein [Lentisphaeria bacterium]
MKKLSQFRKQDLEPYTFPGTDAAVMHVREKIPERELRKICGKFKNTQLRYYSTEEGWDVKIPWWNIAGLDAAGQFERVKRGWDHEHCSFCNESVGIGENCFLHENEDKNGNYLFCQKCYAKIKK